MRASGLLLVAALGFASPLHAASGPAKVQDEARAVLEKAIESMGGDAAVAKIKGMRMATKGIYKMGAMEMPYTATVTYVAPDRFLWKVESPGFQATAGVIGEVAWSQMMAPPARLMGAAKEALVDWVIQTKLFLVRPLLSMENVKISAGRPSKKEGAGTRVRVAFPSGRRLTLGFAVDHGKTTLVSVEGDTLLMDGRKGTMKAAYSAPKAFGPLTVPSRVKSETFFEGKIEESVQEETVSIEWNPDVPAKTFEMPESRVAIGKIEVKKTDAMQGIMLVHAGAYDEMGKTIEKLEAIAHEKGLMPMAVLSIYLNDPAQVKEPSELRTELVLPVMAAGPLPEDLPGGATVKSLPSIEVASMFARGPYGESDSKAFREVMAWIPKNGYAVAGPPRTLYLHDPKFTVAEDLIAEIQIPVRK